MEPLKKMGPLTAIGIRASVCGAITCSMLAFASHRIEVRELISQLHHEPVHLNEWWVQLVIFATGVIFAFFFDKKDLLRSYQQAGQRGIWRSVLGVLGFFALGFIVVGLILPSHT